MLSARQVFSQAPKSQTGFTTVRLLVAAGIAFGLVLVVGLGTVWLLNYTSSDQSNGPVTLKYWGLWESAELMQPLLDEYHTTHPNVTVKYEQRPITNHFATVKSRLADSSNDGPDIVRLHDSWVSALRDNLAPLPASVMSANLYESTFYTVNRDQLYRNNKYYGIPLEVDGLALVYNQDLFNKAGITTPPDTWDDLRQDAAKITTRDSSGKLLVGGVAMGNATNVDHYPDIVALLMAQNGVVFSDADGKAAFNNSITSDGRNLGAEALSFYTLFTTTDKDWDSTMEESTLAFAEGKVGMILIPSWRLLSLVSQNPELPLKVAPVPHLTSDQKTGYASYWVEAVPNNSHHKTAAWQFLSWLTAKEQQQSMVQGQLTVRPFGELFSRKDLADTVVSDQYLSAYAVQAANLKASYFAGDTGANQFNDTINIGLADAINQTLAGGASRDNAAALSLDALAKIVDEVLGN